MHLSSLDLRGFRSLGDQRIELPPEGIAVVADNGSGKTNLLEAIYYLEIFRSFRGAPDEQLVRFGEDVFRVEGRMRLDDRVRTVAAAVDRRARRKKVVVDGTEPERLGDAIGSVGAVVFSPADVTIVSGSPSERRRFLDIVLSLSVPGYLGWLQRYRQVLLRRNALLREGAPAEQVSAWDAGLAEWGSRVVAARAEWIAGHAEAFRGHVRRIGAGTEAQLEYDGSVEPGGEEGEGSHEAIAGLLLRELERVRERERRRGLTVVGPHRDDLRIRARVRGAEGWTDLRAYGSGGQQRTAAVALRMLEAESRRLTTGWQPVILLDDVFAELDPGRSRRILDWIEEQAVGQVILTAPKAADVEVRGAVLPRWTIRDGVVGPL
ncbi:MAG TPA: DNA replication and repair protein RecF [Longimicrobiaceae bacterium]